MKLFIERLATELPMHRRPTRTLESRVREAIFCYSFVGLANGTDSKDLLKSLHRSFAAGRSFAESSNFRSAQEQLGESAPYWEHAQIATSRGCILLIANCSLAALSLIADAQNRGWSLVVEDGPFSRDFIAPVSARGRGVEFKSSHLLAAWMRNIKGTGCHGITLFATFCDRPMRTAGGCIVTEVHGRKYHFSVVDALLMVAAFDEIFVLGQELRKVVVVSRPDWKTGHISGETLFQYTSMCGLALHDLIATDPGKYLGVEHLVTRSEKYRLLMEGRRKSVIKSLLHFCQVRGMSIPEKSYREFLLKLDTRSP